MNEELLYFFKRDLQKVINEIESYEDEEQIWKVEHKINNSAGSLAVHIVGNLNHYIGKTIANTNYVRDRTFEFSGEKIEKTALLKSLKETIDMLDLAFKNITEEKMNEIYAFDFFGKQPTRFYLFQFLVHLSYHLGQINYHKRLTTK